ncbi:3-isopropylmalate dehydrogenase [bacterium]|nr:3-isopropylmalate dehydrogenase [bacterium]
MSKTTTRRIAALPGDGIGPEVMRAALEILTAIGERFDLSFEVREGLIGGAAYELHQEHFPEETQTLIANCDAILFGSVGGPIEESTAEKWRDCEKNSLLGLRQRCCFHANFRPARVYQALQERCPLKKSIIGEGIDLLIVRELLGDLYFGTHETKEEAGVRVARDEARYTEEEIRRIAHTAFRAAQQRKKQLTSVDKANVLDTSKLWRAVMEEVGTVYPDVSLAHMLVDNCAMQLVQNPGQFDTIVTSNMFGDILSDTAAVLPGSLGLTPSASFNEKGFGMYEPSGGSAPDIAGQGVANPTAQILCVALLLRYSFGLDEEAKTIETAVEGVLDDGFRTADIACTGEVAISTAAFAAEVRKRILRTS